MEQNVCTHVTSKQIEQENSGLEFTIGRSIKNDLRDIVCTGEVMM